MLLFFLLITFIYFILIKKSYQENLNFQINEDMNNKYGVYDSENIEKKIDQVLTDINSIDECKLNSLEYSFDKAKKNKVSKLLNKYKDYDIMSLDNKDLVKKYEDKTLYKDKIISSNFYKYKDNYYVNEFTTENNEENNEYKDHMCLEDIIDDKYKENTDKQNLILDDRYIYETQYEDVCYKTKISIDKNKDVYVKNVLNDKKNELTEWKKIDSINRPWFINNQN